jgi:hypothetical protein
MFSQYDVACSASPASTTSPKYRHINCKKSADSQSSMGMRQPSWMLTMCSADIHVLREIDELEISMRGVSGRQSQARTAEKLSVAL